MKLHIKLAIIYRMQLFQRQFIMQSEQIITILRKEFKISLRLLLRVNFPLHLLATQTMKCTRI